MTSAKDPRRPNGRTKIITAASITAVVLASIFAIGANLGILASADQTKVGTVNAAGDLLQGEPAVAETGSDGQGSDAGLAGSQRFAVDAAGTIDVVVTDGRARVALITPAAGWTASAPTTTGTGVAVTFTGGTRTLDFTATVGADGTVTGDVSEAASATPTEKGHDDEGSDHDEGHDHDPEYEGGDFDD